MNFFSIDNLEKYFMDALSEIISKMAGLTFNALLTEENSSFDEITGVMILPGKNNGILFITTNENSLRFICSCMTGTQKEDVSINDIEDTLCELVNMTAGSAKQRLSKSNIIFNLSEPFLFKGKNMQILCKNKTRVISSVLENEEVIIGVKIAYL